MDRGAWQPAVHGVTESDVAERLSLTQELTEIIAQLGSQAGTHQPQATNFHQH